MNVPKLRFPEFREMGEWCHKILGDVSTITTGSSNREDSTVDGGMYTFFDRSQDIRTSGIYLFDGEAIIIAGEGQEFLPKYFIGKFDLHQRTYAIMNFSACSGLYLFYYIYQFRAYFLAQAVGSTVKSLRLPMFQNMPIGLPHLNEQQKIADCLSSLDELVTAETQTLEAYKQHKKGLMQQLFPQTGATTPRLRFPEFREMGEWGEEEFGDIALFSKGKGISKDDVSPDGTLPCIRYGQLYTHYKERITNVISRTNLSEDELVLSKKNDVIIPASGETQIDIATASCVLLDGVALGGDLNIIRSSVNGVFLSYYLNSVKKNEIAKLSQGISVVHLYASQLRTLKVNIPFGSEQQKIAACLSSLDELITAQSQKIVMLKLHKKGLMQGLFPSTGEDD